MGAERSRPIIPPDYAAESQDPFNASPSSQIDLPSTYSPSVLSSTDSHEFVTASTSAASTTSTATSAGTHRTFPCRHNRVSVTEIVKETPPTSMSFVKSRPPLTFHTRHGQNVQLMNCAKVATRVDSFSDAVVFSARPVEIDEYMCIRLTGVASNWTGYLRVGVTIVDPMSLRRAPSNQAASASALAADGTVYMPKFACPNLTNTGRAWGKAVPEKYVKQNAVIHFNVNERGEMYYGVDGGQFCAGVLVSQPFYLFIDIYGNSTSVELVDPTCVKFKGRLKNSQPAPSTTTPRTPSDELMRVDSPLGSHAPQLKTYRLLDLIPVYFHTSHGRHISRISADKRSAYRSPTEFANGYVFTAEPIVLGSTYVVQIVSTLPNYTGALAFGVTACDPLNARTLPDDSDNLLELSDYWVAVKDVVGTPKEGDELTFTIETSGKVLMFSNGERVNVPMHVDESLRLWMWWDLFGSTVAIKLAGVTTQPISTIRQLVTAARASPTTTASTVTRSQSTVSPPTQMVVNLPDTAPPRPPTRPNRASTIDTSSTTLTNASTEDNLIRFDNYVTTQKNDSTARPPVPARPPPPPPRSSTGTDTTRLAPPTPHASASSPSTSDSSLSKEMAKVTMMDSSRVSSASSSLPVDECIICMEDGIKLVVLYKCGHRCMCMTCARQVMNQTGKCPKCRRDIIDIQEVFD